jgi:hypothetical protein
LRYGLARQAPILYPNVYFLPKSINGVLGLMDVAFNREPFLTLPALDSSNISSEVGRDSLPGIKAVITWLVA